MLPQDLAKTDTEHAHQRAFFQWLNFAAYYGFEVAVEICAGANPKLRSTSGAMPELALMHAIPNGGFRRKSEAGKLKAEGVKPGVLDTFLPVRKPYDYPQRTSAQPHYNGLYVEFKEPKRRNHKDGGLSQDQITFGDNVREQGYCVRVAYTWAEAANIVMLYYGVDTRIPT